MAQKPERGGGRGGDPATEAAAVFRAAVRFERAGDKESALGAFHAACRADPTDARNYRNLGVALMRAGHSDLGGEGVTVWYSRSKQALERASALEPGDRSATAISDLAGSVHIQLDGLPLAMLPAATGPLPGDDSEPSGWPGDGHSPRAPRWVPFERPCPTGGRSDTEPLYGCSDAKRVRTGVPLFTKQEAEAVVRRFRTVLFLGDSLTRNVFSTLLMLVNGAGDGALLGNYSHFHAPASRLDAAAMEGCRFEGILREKRRCFRYMARDNVYSTTGEWPDPQSPRTLGCPIA